MLRAPYLRTIAVCGIVNGIHTSNRVSIAEQVRRRICQRRLLKRRGRDDGHYKIPYGVQPNGAV